MQITYPFNDWYYKDSFSPEDIQATSMEGFTQITLPHTNREIPYNYFDETSTMFVSCYRKVFYVPDEWRAKRVFLHFEAVSSVADVYLNGFHLGQHKGGYTAFTFELTDDLIIGSDNTLIVKVDSTERDDVPPFGYLIDYLCYGGIYRETELIVCDSAYVTAMHLTPQNVLSEEKAIDIKLWTDSSVEIADAPLKVTLSKGGEVVSEASFLADIPEGKGTIHLGLEGLRDIKLWSVEDPQMYTVKVELDDIVVEDRCGFRDAQFTVDGFYLNGEKIKLMGLNRHQSYPYVGNAMPKRAQERDAEILRNEMGVNIVRTSHYPQSRHFLNRCDELGLLVFEEIPGWQYIGDEEWKDLSVQNVEDMIMEGYNHPSIILWGVRINESDNDYAFYQRTNERAHELDPTRPTGGVKYIENADFQEDVFVMNDFDTGKSDRSHLDQNLATGLDHDVPYLISEFAGLWHPSKRWDDSRERVEQALRHAWGHDEVALDDRCCGALAWCAFDYNTHFQFGPGDRICYHGVADMFRIPKPWVSAVYESQKDPRKEPVLVPATTWSNGDNDRGGFLPMYIFSNCDYVEVFINGRFARRLFPYRRWFAGLKHAPMYMDRIPKGLWDKWDWMDSEFVGYLDGEAVIQKKFVRNPVPTKLLIKADDNVLHAQCKDEAYDVTRIVFQTVDQYGNSLDYLMDSISISVDGPADLIGPSVTTMQGGCIAAWIRTNGEKGTVTVSAKTSRLESETIEVTVQ